MRPGTKTTIRTKARRNRHYRLFTVTCTLHLPGLLLLACLLLLAPPKALSKTIPHLPLPLFRKQFKQTIHDARQSFVSHDLKKMKQMLLRAQTLLDGQADRPKGRDFDNAVLWYHLLQYKYHQLKGLLPPIKPLEEYQQREELQQHIAQLKEAREHLQQALFHLNRYNRLFKNLSKRLKIKEALALVNTLSQEGILRNRVSIVFLRIFRLNTLLQRWQTRTKTLSPDKKDTRTTQELQLIRQTQLDLKKMFQRQAKTVQHTQGLYLGWQTELRRRERNGKLLTWLGIAGVTSGVLLGATGFILHSESDAWLIYQRQRKYSPTETLQLQQWGTGFIIAGSIVLVAGASSWMFGALMRPAPTQFDKNIYRSHQKILESEDNDTKAPKSSLLHRTQ